VVMLDGGPDGGAVAAEDAGAVAGNDAGSPDADAVAIPTTDQSVTAATLAPGCTGAGMPAAWAAPLLLALLVRRRRSQADRP